MLLALVGLAFIAWWGERRYGWMPGGVKETAGNLLWASSVFCVLGVLRPYWSTQLLAMVTLVIALGVEATQLYAGWPLNLIRGNAVGRAAIGTHFSVVDLAALSVGVLLVSGMDAVVRPAKGKR